MNMTHILTVALVGTAFALAGCTDGGAEANLSYTGEEDGVHSESVTCDDAGTIKGSGSIPDGEVLVTLKDSAGKQLLQQTFKGDFTLDETKVSGSSGSWSFQAQRTSDDLVGDSFSGNYVFNVNC